MTIFAQMHKQEQFKGSEFSCGRVSSDSICGWSQDDYEGF